MSIRLMTKTWNTKISPNKKLTLLALCDNANDEGVCYPSINTLVSKTGLSRPTVIKNIKDLVEIELITTHKRSRKKGGRYSTLYLVFPKENYENLDEEYQQKFSQSKEALPYTQSKEALPQEGIQSKEALPKPSLTLFNHHLYKELNTKEKELYLEYTSLRKSMKVKTTLAIHERLLTKYFKFGRDIAIIENAINANWKDFYEPKKQFKSFRKEPEKHSIAWRMQQQQNEINVEVIDATVT